MSEDVTHLARRAVLGLVLAACGHGPKAPSEPLAPVPSASSTATPPPAPTPPPTPKVTLPRGGRTIFPEHRLVGFCGTPGAPALGRLMGDLGARAKTVQTYVDKYDKDPQRRMLPVFELIAVVVQGAPGADGKWRRRVPDSVVDEYLQAARNAKALLLLNIQPGHSDMLTEAKHFEKYLREPDVGLALDPEWEVKGKDRPGKVYGQTTGAEINDVGTYLAGIVATAELPEKVLVFHQVNLHVVKDENALVSHAGVVLVKGVDGLGPKGAKITTYNLLTKALPSHVHAGFKLFFEEDTANGWQLMSPPEVLGLKPIPEYVMYE